MKGSRSRRATTSGPASLERNSFSYFISLFSSAFCVKILLQLFGRDRGLHTLGGHFGFGAPEQGVEDDFAEILVTPVGVVVAARETKAAPAAGPLAGPHHCFVTPAGGNDVFVWAARIDVRPLANGLGRFGDEDGGEATFFGVRTEAQIEIPFIADAEGLYAALD